MNGKYKQQHKTLVLCKIDTETDTGISEELWDHVQMKRRKILKSKAVQSWTCFRY